MFTVSEEKNIGITVWCDCLDIGRTLDCGQAFRWSEVSPSVWHGVAFGRALTVSQQGDEITFHNTCKEDFERIWKPYFDLERDYAAVCERLSEDGHLKRAISECPGIRILHQEPWEALCSFIISQNNNIPRIKGIIDRLCRLLGDDLGNGDFAFPSAQKVASAGVEGLAPIRAGFRAKYIIDAAEKFAKGEINIEKIYSSPLDEGRDELIKIKGVGEKVARCTLLYGFGKVDSFPVDVWVKRIMSELYPDGLPECTAGVSGIAQQFLFHWRRTVEN